MTASPDAALRSRPRIQVRGIWLDAITEREVVAVVRHAWARGNGGSIMTVNVDIARTLTRDASLAGLMGGASIVVADGMPVVWAARVAGSHLPERVTGASLVHSLSQAAAADGRSIFILGGPEGVPAKAASALQAQLPNVRIAGTDVPPAGFDKTAEEMQRTVDRVAAAAPGLVLVGLGFPRQERLIEQMQRVLPSAWYLACGAGVPMCAGVFRRAKPGIQRMGLEWLHRLALEPTRLAPRYLCDDLPFALALLARSAGRRFSQARPWDHGGKRR